MRARACLGCRLGGYGQVEGLKPSPRTSYRERRCSPVGVLRLLGLARLPPPPPIDERGGGECGRKWHQGLPRAELLLGCNFIQSLVGLGVRRLPWYGEWDGSPRGVG